MNQKKRTINLYDGPKDQELWREQKSLDLQAKE